MGPRAVVDLLRLPRIEPQIDWLCMLGCSRTTKREARSLNPDVQVGATLGSDYRGCTVGSFVRGPFSYLTNVAFDFSSRAWAAG